MVSATITGIDDLKRALEELSSDLRRKTVRAAIRDALQPPRKAAAENAPFVTGLLRRSVYAANSKIQRGQGGVIGGYVGVRKGKRRTRQMKALGVDAYYAKFVEIGTRKMTAEPFLKPAGQSTASQSIEIFNRRIAERIAKANRRK